MLESLPQRGLFRAVAFLPLLASNS